MACSLQTDSNTKQCHAVQPISLIAYTLQIMKTSIGTEKTDVTRSASIHLITAYIFFIVFGVYRLFAVKTTIFSFRPIMLLHCGLDLSQNYARKRVVLLLDSFSAHFDDYARTKYMLRVLTTYFVHNYLQRNILEFRSDNNVIRCFGTFNVILSLILPSTFCTDLVLLDTLTPIDVTAL